jgi:hypothetical protein
MLGLPSQDLFIICDLQENRFLIFVLHQLIFVKQSTANMTQIKFECPDIDS